MLKRILALALAVGLLLSCLPAQAAQLSTAASYDIRLRSSSSRVACIMRIGKQYYRTTVNYISLKHPITISVADATANGKGSVVAVSYITSNKGTETTQYLTGCSGLHLTCDEWPMVTVDGSYNRPLLVNGGVVNDMRIDGGMVTFDGVTVKGTIELRGERTVVNFVDCTFEEGAGVQTSDTVIVLENGEVVR